MKLLIIILSMMVASVTQIWVTDGSLPKLVEKRFQKNIQKLFKGEEFTKTAIIFNDSLPEMTNNYFYRLENLDQTKWYMVGITIANGCKLGGCNINARKSNEFEVFYIYSLYDSKGVLSDLKILDYQSEHGYEITAKWWLKQFITSQDLIYEYGKNIDAISGATTSVKSTINEMNRNKKIISDLVAK